MQVEECCQQLLRSFLPDVDPKREGFAIDVGVGTFSFFCETFAKIGFKTIAVEPMPTDNLKLVCKKYNIRLVESALSNVNDTVTLYVGAFRGTEDHNLNSLYPDWWGGSTKTKQVSSITLAKLMEQIGQNKVTCMKLDVEGAERTIISQFPDLPPEQIPSVVMFEYGGGAQHQEGISGWSPSYIASTMDCLRMLKKCGFDDAILIESNETQERVLSLSTVSLTEDVFFKPQDVYGNIITFRQYHPDRQKLVDISRQYASNDVPPPSFLTRLLNFSRRLYQRQ